MQASIEKPSVSPIDIPDASEEVFVLDFEHGSMTFRFELSDIMSVAIQTHKGC